MFLTRSAILRTYLYSANRFFTAWLLFIMVSGPALAVPPDMQSTLIVGSEQDYPPFATGKTDQTAGGFTVDLWRAVASEDGLNYRIRVLPFHQLLDEFKQGKIDVLINLAQSNERHQFADFTVPHVIVHGAIFVRKGETAIQSEADLAGKSIIVLNADLAHDYAVSKGWGTQLVLVDTAAKGLRLLASGKYDAMLLSKLAGMQTLQSLGIQNIVALKTPAGFSQKFSFAVHQGQSILLAKINEGLALTKSNGTYDALYEKWFGVYETKETGLSGTLIYLLPVILILAGIAGFFYFQRQTERKTAEKKYRDLYDHAPDMFMSVEAKTFTIINCNQTLLDTTGYTKAALIGRPVFELYHPDSINLAKSAYQHLFATSEIHGKELQLQCKDGRKIEVSLNATAVCNKQGKILHSRSSLRDITGRKLAETKLNTLYTAVEQSPVSVVIADIDAIIEYVNPRFSEITGYSKDEAIGQNPRILQSGLTPPDTYLELWNKVTRGEIWHGELINKRKNGEIYSEEAHISPVKNTAGALTHFVAVKVDITRRKQDEAALKLSEERFRFMLENSPIAVRITNKESSRVIFSNQRYAELIEMESAKVHGINPKKYYAHPQDYEDVIDQIGRGERVTDKLIELAIPNHQTPTKWVLASYLQLEYQNEPAVLGWFYDITDRKTLEEKIQHLAHYDPLTDLPNRTLFTDRLQRALTTARRDMTHLALMFIDLDKFKPINDRHGHTMGDQVLKEVALRIKACLRESDTVARIGGDEFVVLLPSLESELDALNVAEKIRHVLNQPIRQAGHTLSISSSTGIAIYPEHGTDEKQLIKNADTAMYYAKEAGRDNVKLYQPDEN